MPVDRTLDRRRAIEANDQVRRARASALSQTAKVYSSSQSMVEVLETYDQALWQVEQNFPAPEWVLLDVYINDDTPILTAVKCHGQWRDNGHLIYVVMWRERPQPPKNPPRLW